MSALGQVTTERLEAELADRWARRYGAPTLDEVQRFVTSMGDLLKADARAHVVLVVPLRDDAPTLLRAMADELEDPPGVPGSRRVLFRDLQDGRPWLPPGV